MASHQPEEMLTLFLTMVLLALPSYTYGVTLHVRPTSNTSCPIHPCHTLSEYAADPGQYFNDLNLTLQFLPGNHTVNVNLSITNVDQLQILGNSSAVTPTIVACSTKVGFAFSDISKVKINSLAFLACARFRVTQAPYENYQQLFQHFTTYYGLYLQSVQMTEIIDCTFQDSVGSALGVFESHVVLRGNNNFLDNCKLCLKGMCDWLTTGLHKTCLGGGVFAKMSTLIFTGNSTFIGNSALYGGGVYSLFNSNVNIGGNTTFIANSARKDGGGFYLWSNKNIIVNTSFTPNPASGDGRGVTAELSTNIDISGNTTFIGNSASDGCGGGVYIGSNNNMTIIENATFIDNSASGFIRGSHGGGIYIESNCNVNISGNAIFVGNSADSGGGAVCVGLNNSVYINGNTSIFGNSGKWFGGGVYAGSSNYMDISGNTTFIGNSAGNGGGVYVMSNSNVTISENATFIGNSASGFFRSAHGGGIYIGSNSNVNISGNTTFIANTARGKDARSHIESACRVCHSGGKVSLNRCGGGVYVDFNSNANISGKTSFIGNSAEKYGGGVCLDSKSKVDICGNTTFIGNLAFDGGGVYSWAVNYVNISGNTTFIGNSAIHGGGISAVANSRVIICGNTTFISNLAINGGGGRFVESSLSLERNIRFANCSATNDGGAIYGRGVQVNLSGTTVFNANRATHFGGGMYASKSSLEFPGNSTFTTNSAGSKGGGIYVHNTKINFSGTCLLSGNMAKLDGGAVYADSSNLNLNGSITIRNNTAQLGGGVYSDNNTFNVDGQNIVERNVALHYGGGIYTRRSPLTLPGNNTFISNSAGEGGGIHATSNSTLNLSGVNTFICNKAHVSGGGIWLDNSNLALNRFNHFVKCVASYEGGAIFSYDAKLSLVGNNIFESNSATTGGGIHARWSYVRVTNNSNFTNNVAVFGGGIYTNNSTFEFHGSSTFNGSSTFSGNHANHTGGGIYAARSVLNFLGTSSITANSAARDGGGIYTRDDCVVNLLGLSNYQDNSAGDTGGGISVYRGIFNLGGQSTFNSNHAVEGGGIYAFKSAVNSFGENAFITNSAIYHGGGFAVMHSTLHLNGSTMFINNLAASGGGMHIGDSTVDSDGSNCFMNNKADSGGGIYAADSTVKFNGNDMLLANSARNKGAAIHSSSTTLIFEGGSSFVSNSAEYGGGIHSERSNLTFVHHGSNHYSPSCINCSSVCNDSLNPESVFLNNTALQGGAQYFDLYSNFTQYETAQVHFQDNHAVQFGGAIYAADVPGPGQFLSQQRISFRSECFFHMLRKKQSPDINTTPLVFVNNSAGIRGSILYGGLLEKCNFTSDRYTSAIELFSMSISHVQRKDNTGHSISSDPSQLCFCNTTGLNCEEVLQSRHIYPGQHVAVSVVAIDQSGSAIPTLIHTNIHSGHNLTVSEIISYETGGNCTNRNYSVTPNNIFNQLELYPNNRSGNTIHLIVNITFDRCPIGFEQSNFTGECICDHRLWQYTNTCDVDKQAILRNASRTFWLGVWYNNGTLEGYIHHRYCPLDYCTSESKHIDLHNPDKQCSYNRSGLLCGKCKANLSLVLGSSQCKQCSNNYLALLIPFALAGVLLVILLFLLHLTVAEGTLHGLIFYANFVAANHHIFFPHTSNDPVSVFIAWLNLDLGIETCFYNGMDVYAKTWLEFVFPVYIWVIVGFLVYISHHSVTVTKLLGSSPVPVLATLFLLSYAKVLRTIIAALSLTILHYPDKDVVVWIHDANVSLAKYIPLVLVALLFFLFLFLPYTMLLLLGQWLQSKSHFHLFSWVRSPKVKAILDTYHAPYKLKHRYWTGLLLLVRCALFLVFAFNISGDDNVNLLVISSTAFGIIGWLTFSGVVYKSRYLNALEVSFILNLGILAVATYHVTLSGGSQAAVAYTSVGIAFLTFVGIVIYHIYTRIKSKVQYIQRGYQLKRENNCHINKNNDNPGSLCHQPRATQVVTRTEVNLHELRSPLDLLSYHQMD